MHVLMVCMLSAHCLYSMCSLSVWQVAQSNAQAAAAAAQRLLQGHQEGEEGGGQLQQLAKAVSSMQVCMHVRHALSLKDLHRCTQAETHNVGPLPIMP